MMWQELQYALVNHCCTIIPYLHVTAPEVLDLTGWTDITNCLHFMSVTWNTSEKTCTGGGSIVLISGFT